MVAVILAGIVLVKLLSDLHVVFVDLPLSLLVILDLFDIFLLLLPLSFFEFIFEFIDFGLCDSTTLALFRVVVPEGFPEVLV